MAKQEVVPFDLATSVVRLYRDGTSAVGDDEGGEPDCVDGLIVGAPVMTESAPHGGEMHPDGDELLYLISGAISVELELDDGDTTLDVAPGQAVIVPKGIWHRVVIREPSQLVYMTPGPGSEHRPLPG